MENYQHSESIIESDRCLMSKLADKYQLDINSDIGLYANNGLLALRQVFPDNISINGKVVLDLGCGSRSSQRAELSKPSDFKVSRCYVSWLCRMAHNWEQLQLA